MPNYSIRSVPRLNTTGARQYLDSLEPLQRAYYDQNPAAAYQTYIQSLNPSQSMDRYLRSLYEILRTDWFAKVSDRAKQGIDYQWADYLRDFNPQTRVNMAEPNTRFESPQRFQGRARVIAF